MRTPPAEPVNESKFEAIIAVEVWNIFTYRLLSVYARPIQLASISPQRLLHLLPNILCWFFAHA